MGNVYQTRELRSILYLYRLELNIYISICNLNLFRSLLFIAELWEHLHKTESNHESQAPINWVGHIKEPMQKEVYSMANVIPERTENFLNSLLEFKVFYNSLAISSSV